MGGSRYPKRLVPSRGRYLSGMNLRTGGVRGVPGTCKGLVYRVGGVCVCLLEPQAMVGVSGVCRRRWAWAARRTAPC